MAHAKSLENAEDQCFSYSNEHNTVPRAGIEPTSKNTCQIDVGGEVAEKRCSCGDSIQQMATILSERGFSALQLGMIDQALRNTGLEIRPIHQAPYKT